MNKHKMTCDGEFECDEGADGTDKISSEKIVHHV